MNESKKWLFLNQNEKNVITCSFFKYFYEELFTWFASALLRSVHGVLNWESNGGSAEDVHALLDHGTIIVVPEETPDTDVPASREATEGLGVDEVVPHPWGEGLDETGRGGGNHKGGHEDGGGEGLLLIFVHF